MKKHEEVIQKLISNLGHQDDSIVTYKSKTNSENLHEGSKLKGEREKGNRTEGNVTPNKNQEKRSTKQKDTHKRHASTQNNNYRARKEIDRSSNVIVTGHIEEDIKLKGERRKSEVDLSKKIIHKLIPEEKIENYECQRLGEYKKGKSRPLRITFENSHTAEKAIKNGPNIKKGINNIKL